MTTDKTTEQQIAELKRQLQVYMTWCALLMAELVKRNIPVPEKPVKEKVR